MDLSKTEILRKHLKQSVSEFQDLGHKNTFDAMEEYAEQQAKSFADWLLFQDLGRKTINKLWNEFNSM